MNKQSGFTLVELVVVIVILGLLAAAALPRFIDVTENARISSLNGVAGGLRSAVALAKAQYVVNGSTSATSVVMEGQTVTVLDEDNNAGLGGRPTQATGGIEAAMPNPDGYTVTHATAGSTYVPDNGGGTTCRVTYDADATGDPVSVDDSGC